MNKKKFTTYTKRMITSILIVALIDLQLSYVLAFMGKENTMENIAQDLIISIIGVVIVYCAKSFFETKEEKKNELIEKTLNSNNSENGEENNEIISG